MSNEAARLAALERRILQLERLTPPHVTSASSAAAVAAEASARAGADAALSADITAETNARVDGDAALDARVTPLESQLATYPTDYGDLLPAVAPPDIDTASDIGTAGYGFAYANHTHGGAGGGSPGAWAAPDYASSPASNTWKAFPGAGDSGFTKLACRVRLNAAGVVEIEGSVRRVTVVGPSGGEVLFRLPSSSMYPKQAGERVFRCPCWAGATGVHITGTDYASGAGWVRIYDWSGQPERAISLDGITFTP